MCQLKEIGWIGSSLDDLKKLPSIVKQEIGYTLYEVQQGKKPDNIKFLKGFNAGVMEIISCCDKNTYRAIYC